MVDSNLINLRTMKMIQDDFRMKDNQKLQQMIIIIDYFKISNNINSLMIEEKEQIAPYILAEGFKLNPQLARLLSAKKDGYCRISNLRWVELNMPHVSGSLVKWNVKHLDIQQNKEAQIVKQISIIKFPRLKILNISSNLIQSIQPLYCLNCRNLEQLNISNNKIMELRSLRKLHTFRLRTLKICSNLFQNCIWLSEMPLMNLQVLVLQNEIRKSDTYLNLWVLTKMEGEYLKSLYVRNIREQYKKIGRNQLSVIRNRFFNLNPGRNL